jgi:hypothetical protein
MSGIDVKELYKPTLSELLIEHWNRIQPISPAINSSRMNTTPRGLLIFRKPRTTTVPGKASSVLVTWGPYRFTRNPMYVSLLLAYLGEAGILRQIWPVALLPLVLAYLNWIVIPVEEAKLSQVFGEAYETYRARVRRWI